jgi:DNA-binding transcriptional regulator YiaG
MSMATDNFSPDFVTGLRATLQLTQVELAERVGVSQPTVALWEAGLRRPSGAATILLRQVEAEAQKKSRKKTRNTH